MKRNRCFFKVVLITLVLSLVFNTLTAVAETEIDITKNPLQNIKSDEVKDVLENSVVFYEGFYQAIAYGEKVMLADGDTKTTAVSSKSDLLIPTDFLIKTFGGEISKDKIVTSKSIDYCLLKDFAEANNLQYIKKGLITVVSEETNLSGIVDKNFADLEKLFGVFVSVGAQKGNPGTIDKPVSNLEEAKSVAVKNLKQVGSVGEELNVYFRGGDYRIEKGIKMDANDSGTENCTIVFQNYPGEAVSFDGGISITGSQFTNVTTSDILSRIPAQARDNVRQFDLSKIGYIPADDATNPATNEIYYNEQNMQISRWPNFEFAKTGDVIKPGDPVKKGIEYVVNSDQILTWGKANDAWLFGHYVWEWSSNSLKVTKIDLDKRSVATQTNPQYIPIAKGRDWYIYNLIEELDTENEFFIDRKTSILYMIPYVSHLTDGRFATDKIQIPTLTDTMITMNNTSYVEFKGITFENSLGGFINATDIKNCKFTGNTMKNTPKIAIEVRGDATYKCIIDSCDVYNIGENGIVLATGNRQKLIRSESLVTNCRIHNTSRIKRTNCASLAISGIGNTASHNEIFNVPHIAVNFSGNQNTFEYNEVYDALTDEASDAGAIYAGRNNTYYDNVVRYNYIHDLPVTMAAIYQDDHITGMDIYGNVFYNTSRGVFIHGGQYNNFYNNIFIHPKNNLMAIQYNKCTQYSWDPETKKVISSASGWDKILTSINEKDPIWLEKYPMLNEVWSRGYVYAPEHSFAKNNVGVYQKDNTTELVTVSKEVVGAVEVGKNFKTTQDVGFVDMANKNFALKEDSIVYKELPEFKPIPFDQIGLVKNEYRTKFNDIGTFDLIYPANNAINLEARDITFRWQLEPNTRKYRFELATDREFTDVIRDQIVLGSSVLIKNLRYNESRYYWRVSAINNNAKNIEYGKVVKSNVDYYSFTTKQSETIDMTEANSLMTEMEKVYENMVEGDQPGQYFKGSKDMIKQSIDNFKLSLKDDKLIQKKLNKNITKLSKDYTKVKGRRNPEILPINDLLKFQTDWSFQENRAYFKPDGIEWTRGGSGDNQSAGYKAQKLENHQIIRFKARLDFKTNNWMYFGLRSTDSLATYAASSLYFVVIKEDKFELQKRPGNILKEYPNDCVKYGEDFEVEYGALDQEDGSVRILFKVNGNTIIDFIDKDKPVTEPGYFSVFNSGVGNTIKIMPVDLNK